MAAYHKRAGAPSVYGIITERIIAKLESGVVPWRQPWANVGMPRNLASGREYRGVNVFLLASARFAAPYWLTYRQAQERGGNVRKGERSTPVVFWKQWEVTDRDTETGEPIAKRIPILRYYNVFNVEQCDGVAYQSAAKVA